MKFKQHTSPKLLRYYKSKLSIRDWEGMIEFDNLERCNDVRKATSAGRIKISNKSLNRLQPLVYKKIKTINMELVTITIGVNVGIDSFEYLVKTLNLKDCRVKILYPVQDNIDISWIEY
ncbi:MULTISPECIES: hypothetical protein [Vibrio]|jgi:hypothetical protein|uniref:hypothetical protein n=1 Tax=Vibrio TaxID=662 RepID=UPI0011B66C61|nr:MULTISPECIES: hypothetical protein [Vibrio]